MDGNETRKVGRRALLAAGAAGVAAAAAQALAPASVLAGGDHQPVIQGETNTGTLTTVVTAPGASGLEGNSDAGDGLRGISKGAGKSGVYGYNSNADGYGVFGRNDPGGTSGLLGGRYWGVKGDGGAGVGVNGNSSGGDGVMGFSAGAGKSGVNGSNNNAYGYGVSGSNNATGALGRLGDGMLGVFAQAPVDSGHWALAVDGRAGFARSGLLTIAKNKSSVSASVPALTATGPMPTMVLATLQTNRAGVYIQAAVAYVNSGKITIYLNKKVTAATKVAYFVLN